MAGTLLITGASGQLGQALVREAGRQGWEVVASDAHNLDITDPQAVWGELSRRRPEVVINAAAATRVDELESDLDGALRVNALGPRNLAVACRRLGVKLIHVSTRLCLRRGQSRALCGVGRHGTPVGLWTEQAPG